MKKILLALMGLLAFVSLAKADQVLIIDAQYDQVTNNVKGRLEAAGHTVTITTDVSSIPTVTTTYQQVWDLRYSAALTSGEQTAYQTYVTNGGFAYFVTENPGCCQARNNSVAALITNLGGGTTTIGANFAMTNNVSSNVNTTYMTAGITVNYAAVSAIVNSQGIPLISDGNGAVSGMSWIGRAGALGSGVTGTIVTVADTNWLDQSRFSTAQGATLAQQQNVTALDDIIRGIVAGTVAGTISASGNGAGSQQQGGGTPPPPTVVSTAAGPNNIVSATTYGTATTSIQVVDARTNGSKTFTITRTKTPITTTPFTNTITTTPSTVTTYSDGSTVTTNGTPTTSSTTGNVVTIGQPTSESASVSAVGLKDALAVRNFNPFLVDVLSTKDGAWATPLMGYAKADGTINTSSIGFGAQKTFENNTLGIAGTFGKSDSKDYLNSTSNSDMYGATAYFLNRQNAVWTKVAAGFSVSEYNTTTSIPIFALSNSNKVKVNNYYADLTFYSGKEFRGFRPLVGVTLNKSGVVSQSESGSPLLSTLPEKDSSFEARPYAGVRYDIDWFALETRVTQSKDFHTVGQVRASVKKEVFKNVSIDLTGGFDKSSNYTAAVGMVGLKINF